MFKSWSFYFFGFALVMLASYVGNQYRNGMQDDERDAEFALIKTYLLNDSPLYGKNRPKLWIHSKYEVNARQWKNFMSRNTTDLNQPYLSLTIESIIRHCGEDFHICLIDDQSFQKLLPNWDVALQTIPEPMRSRYRDMGMIQLLRLYGGIIVPNSFLCTKPLLELHKHCPFVVENIRQSRNTPFAPDMKMMGAKKNDPLLDDLMDFLVLRERKGHFSNETEFLGEFEKWCILQIEERRLACIDGKAIGIKTRCGKPIRLEDLMEEDYLDVEDSLYGIYIPQEELLRRPKFQWFAILPKEEVLNSRVILAKYFQASMIDGSERSMAVP